MNKLEKILAQSVTPEMVSEHLTEQEIEEVIEEYETKIANAEEDIELVIEKEQAMLKRAEDWKHVTESKLKKVEAWRSVVNKAKQALKRRTTSPNEQRSKLIKEAKEYIQENKYGLEAKLDRADRMVTVHDYGAVNKKYIYPPHLTWNNHIAKAWGMAKFNTDDELIYKFGIGAPQPMEIVPGMDVITYEPDESIHMEGRVKEVSEKLSDLIFYDDKLYKENGYPHAIATSIGFGFTITDDTKAKYKEDEK